MSDNNNGSDERQNHLREVYRNIRFNADEGREPDLLSSQMGRRMVSFNALVERVVAAFIDEHSGGTTALHEADTETKRVKLVLATVDYVLAVESMSLADKQKADLVRRVYTEVFTYGPLDDLLLDPRVTTINIDGADSVAVRYGHGDFTSLGPLFEDEPHLRKIINRLLLDSGAELSPDQAILETGLRLNGRPISLSVVSPPVTFQLSADIRVHPTEPVTLAAMVDSGIMPQQAARLLEALAASPHGLVIVGDTESGKTTLLSALAQILPGQMIAVERAGELHLPAGAGRRVVRWRTADHKLLTFGTQIEAALEESPDLLLIDEVRADEPEAIGGLLAEDATPRQIWTFRGPSDVKRLTAALGMVARRSATAQGAEAHVQRLYNRLPFVVMLRRRKDYLQLTGVGEWQFPDDAEYPSFVELMAPGWEGLEVTGKRPIHPLQLDDSFWQPGT